jgi:hypothetical protein
VKVSAATAEITSADAGLLGGQMHATGKVDNGDKPAYAFEWQLEKVSAAELCELMNLKCTGANLEGEGKVELAGYAGKDLADSAKGSLHFEWKKGAVAGRDSGFAKGVPTMLARFDRWSGDAEIANGTITLKENHVQAGARTSTVSASVSLSDPPKVSFAQPKSAAAAKK